jgi:hypothetical protein
MKKIIVILVLSAALAVSLRADTTTARSMAAVSTPAASAGPGSVTGAAANSLLPLTSTAQPVVTVAATPAAAPVTSTAAPVSITQSAASSTTQAAASSVTAKDLSPKNIQFDTSDPMSIKISWVKTYDDPVYYNVFRNLVGGSQSRINVDAFVNTGYVDSNLQTATAYEYQVEALDLSKTSYKSEKKQVSSSGLKLPQKPATFQPYQDVENVVLKWTAGANGSFPVSGYNLYRGKTPDKMEKLKFLSSSVLRYDDSDVESAIKYYYKMRAIDIKGYESDPTDTMPVVPFPPTRTGLVLMPTGFRNNIYDNLGLNADFIFSYYIGSIYSKFDIGRGPETSTLKPLSVILFTGDVKGTMFNEFESWPSLGLGFAYTILMQYNLGGSEATGFSQTFTMKDSVKKMYGFYLTGSKKVAWDTSLHLSALAGLGNSGLGRSGESQTGFMVYLSPYLTHDAAAQGVGGSTYVKPSNYAYSIGFSRPILTRMGIKIEYIVPVESNRNPVLPDYYLINTHIDRFINFDLGYFHYPGGCAVLGYISLRFTVFPNPYK